MKIKIICCSDENYWYKNNIGEYFDVEEVIKESPFKFLGPSYKVIDTFLIIRKSDAKTINEIRDELLNDII